MGGKTIEMSFRTNAKRVFEASKLAIASLGYTVLASDAESKIISFNTGRSMNSWAGQDLTATMIEAGGVTRVIVGGSIAKGGNPLGGGSQLFAWGEKEALSKKFLATLGEALSSLPAGTEDSANKVCPECAEEVKFAAVKCRFCGHQFQSE